MTCEKIQDMLSPYLDQVLSQEETASVEKHLATCPDCRRELEDLKKTSKLMQNMPEIPLPTDFQRDLHHQLSALDKKGKSGKFMGGIFTHRWAPLAMAAVLMLILYPVISSLMTNPWNSAAPIDDAGTSAPGISESQNSALMQDDSDEGIQEQKIKIPEQKTQVQDNQESNAVGVLENNDENNSTNNAINREEKQAAENKVKSSTGDQRAAAEKKPASENKVQPAQSAQTQVTPEQKLAKETEKAAPSDQILMRRAVPEDPSPKEAPLPAAGADLDKSAKIYEDTQESAEAFDESKNMLMMQISPDQVVEHQVSRDQYQDFIERMEKLPAANPDVLEVTKEVTAPEEPERYFILVSEGKTTQVISTIRGLTKGSAEEKDKIPLTLNIREKHEND
ncbi:anti-sigma factor family protein [Dehalobacterium formicoaceticum]|uniref:Anti-sigma-W factor RsiW n=1 Tax=Dehalobacterium formicoaceticum TaxID=51515 RepID=A0ABT1Y6K1_9FIRM|nr:zf-HC2 domain-containing protein [Dehalobacterium formicoaceticum]MCR6546091.1 zf-HC2 domain-containing protein [Dehalobacterium formicoaceticum]